ncbi:MAG: ATP-binding cassette domain-containing protein, partial [Xanthobacteraceae bacterium]
MASVAKDIRILPAETARSEPEESPYLEFRELSKIYATDDGPVRALDGISIGQCKREFLSILGPSGCGKSTLLMIAAGLLPASHGQVSVQGQRIGAPRTD